jgi:hypothetical protein
MRVAALTRSHYRFRPTNQNTKSLGRLLQRSDAYRLIFHGKSRLARQVNSSSDNRIDVEKGEEVGAHAPERSGGTQN